MFYRKTSDTENALSEPKYKRSFEVDTEKGVQKFDKALQAVWLHFSLYNIVINCDFYNLSEKEYFSC
jgi:hypothetical protein